MLVVDSGKRRFEMQEFAVIDSFVLVSIYRSALPVRSPAGGGGEEILAFSRLRKSTDRF